MLHTEHKNIPTVQQHSPLDAKSHIDELRFFRTRDRITSSFTLPPTLFDPKVIRFNGLGPIREEFRINGFEIEPIGISNSAEFCPNKRELNFNVGDIPSKAAFTVELVQTDKGLAFKVSKTYSNASPWFVQIPEEYFKSSEKQQDFLTNLREDLKAIYQSDVSSWQSFASQATPIKNDVNFPASIRLIGEESLQRLDADIQTFACLTLRADNVKSAELVVPLNDHVLKRIDPNLMSKLMEDGCVEVNGMIARLDQCDGISLLRIELPIEKSENGFLSYKLDLRCFGLDYQNPAVIKSKLNFDPPSFGGDIEIGVYNDLRFRDVETAVVEGLNFFEKTFGVEVGYKIRLSLSQVGAARLSYSGGRDLVSSKESEITVNPSFMMGNPAVLYHELGHYLHYNDPTILQNLILLDRTILERGLHLGLNDAALENFHHLLNESFSQKVKYELNRMEHHNGVIYDVRMVGDNTVDEIISSGKLHLAGHTEDGPMEIFASLTSLVLSDEKTWREFFSRVNAASNDQYLGLMRSTGALSKKVNPIELERLTNVKGSNLTAEKFLDLLDKVYETYENILRESASIPKDAPIFDRIRRFRNILREYQKTGNVF